MEKSVFLSSVERERERGDSEWGDRWAFMSGKCVWGGEDAEMTFLTLGTSCSRALVGALVGVKRHTTILSTVVGVA